MKRDEMERHKGREGDRRDGVFSSNPEEKKGENILKYSSVSHLDGNLASNVFCLCVRVFVCIFGVLDVCMCSIFLCVDSA